MTQNFSSTSDAQLDNIALQQAQGALDNAQASQDVGKKYRQSLMDPDQIKKLRDDALQAIGRGNYEANQFGKSGMLDAPAWAGLQSLMAKPQVQAGSFVSSPTKPFQGQIDQANMQTAQNQQSALSNLTKVAPLLSNVYQGAENSYNSPAALQGTFDSGALTRQQDIGLKNAQLALNAANTVNAIGQSSGDTNVNDSSKSLAGSYTASTSSLATPPVDINQYTNPDDIRAAKQVNNLIIPNQSRDNITQQQQHNTNTLSGIAGKYTGTGLYSEDNIAAAEQAAKSLNSLKGKDIAYGVYKDMPNISPKDLTTSLQSGSWFTSLGSKLGTGSPTSVALGNISALMPQLPQQYQDKITNIVANAVNSKGSIPIAQIQTAINNGFKDSKADYARGKSIIAIAGDNPQFTQGGASVDNLQSQINNSPSLSDISIDKEYSKQVGKDVTHAEAVAEKLQKIKQFGLSKGIGQDNITVQQLRFLNDEDNKTTQGQNSTPTTNANSGAIGQYYSTNTPTAQILAQQNLKGK